MSRSRASSRRPVTGVRQTLSARVACMLVASVVGMSLGASSMPGRPALVVNIMVDGLSMQSLDMLRGYFGQGGFNRLIDKGLTIGNLEYGTPLNASAATAVIHTGASPSVNGVDAPRHYDPVTRRVVLTLNDPDVMGNSTDVTLSAARLLTSTIGDELRVATGGLGYVYSIAPDPTQAVIMAGHAGNSGVWIDDVTGRWASSTYYTEMPSPVTGINRLRPLAARLDTLTWVPVRDQSQFADLPSYKKLYPFRHTFRASSTDRYRAFVNSAPVNTEVTDVAGEYIKVLGLGAHEGVDMLNLAYTLQPFIYSSDPDTRAELIDSYIRLDGELERLFRAIDASGPGIDRTLVVVTGTPVSAASLPDDPKWRIPSGVFSPVKAASLLNMYLMAIHGNGEWVNAIHDGQVYLNRQMIKDRGKDLAAMRSETAEFMTRLSGVSGTHTLDDITSRHNVSDAYARNIDVLSAGDVFFELTPGWQTELSQTETPATVHRAGAVSSSVAFIMAPGVDAGTIQTPVDARSIAPTVASILRIRSPNAASVAPLGITVR